MSGRAAKVDKHAAVSRVLNYEVLYERHSGDEKAAAGEGEGDSDARAFLSAGRRRMATPGGGEGSAHRAAGCVCVVTGDMEV